MSFHRFGALLLVGTAAAACAHTALAAQQPAHVHAPAQAHPCPPRASASAPAHHAPHPAAGDSAHHAPSCLAEPDTGHAGHTAAGGSAAQPGGGHSMWMRPLGCGWSVMGMAQAFPIVTAGAAGEGSPLNETELYLTQPAAMLNLESPGQRVVLRTTLNFEALTQEDGELTFGGWGEGFIDRRHPHTLLHEAMLSLNLWDAGPGSLSLSAGKGFAPYGTDDPMSRPVAKYPTNHHLSQVLERWTLAAAYTLPGWSLEAGLFGGQEPDGPYDFSNAESFGDSYSARVTRHFGPRTGMTSPWELSASWGSVAEAHHGEKERTTLLNAALRHDAPYGAGRLYALAEASRSDPEGSEEGYYSLLGEAMWTAGRHQPYLRVEYATRPEYEREGVSGDPFFRYHHDDEAIGATRWLIGSVGYSHRLTGYPFAAAPFVEVQHSRVWEERGGISPDALFGRDTSWSLTAGARIFLGSGGPMRMGTYGVRDEMTTLHRGTGEHPVSSSHAPGHGH